MAFNYMAPLRAVQALFAIITLGLTAYVASWYNTRTNSDSPHQVNFLIFVSFWTLFVTVYLALSPVYFPRFAHKYAILALDAVTSVFWFAGFIALGVFLSHLSLCLGKVCRVARAAAVFGGFEWLLFLAATILAALYVWRTRSVPTGKPAQSIGGQV